jgi:hypothetical protein
MRATPLSTGKVNFAWGVVVGAAMRRATSVRLEDTKLLVDATTPQWAREVTRAAPMILSRLQALLGAKTITGIRVRDRD